MLSLVVYIAPFLLGIVALVSLIVAVANFRRVQRAPYYRIRRESSRHAWRWLLILVLAAGGGFAAVQVRQFVPPLDLEELFPPAPTATPTFGLGALPTLTTDPELTPRDIFEGPPTITPTQSPPTLSPTPYIATIESTVTPPADASLTITAVSSGISPNLTPVNVGDTFPVGTARIYFWVEYANMANGMSWSRALLLNGTVVRTESEAWERGSEGIAYYWFDAQGGWPAGSYEVQFYLGDRQVSSATYSVVN